MGVVLNVSMSLPAPHGNRRDLPGDLAIWCFILAELLVFGVFFLAYAFARAHNVELFNASQQDLNRTSGAINTLVLITSSYFVVLAVDRIRQGHSRACTRWLIAAMACGAAFLVLKMVEFSGKIEAGISMSTNTFYMFYLGRGFFHFMHVMLGMVILAPLRSRHGAAATTPADHAGVETGASYWHMVDLVWIVLFPLDLRIELTS